jgi:hypothetical protein
LHLQIFNQQITSMKKHFFTLSALLFLLNCAAAQNFIQLANPSFEDEPRHSTAPSQWINCGRKEESPPDIQPGSFSVKTRAFHGDTYVGMVTRDNNTRESIAQALSTPLQKDTAYTFRLYLASSESFLSISQTTKEAVLYNHPVGLKIWGGDTPCQKGELLAESLVVSHTGWKPYTFELKPETANWKCIMLEVCQDGKETDHYNGNILIDHCSDIVKQSAEKK